MYQIFKKWAQPNYRIRTDPLTDKNIKKYKEVNIVSQIAVTFGGGKELWLWWIQGGISEGDGKLLFIDLGGGYKDVCQIVMHWDMHLFCVAFLYLFSFIIKS